MRAGGTLTLGNGCHLLLSMRCRRERCLVAELFPTTVDGRGHGGTWEDVVETPCHCSFKQGS
eukprot:jgi/Botrbrau1/12166/Bobra.0186s0074.1